jgi:hypothetical protein
VRYGVEVGCHAFLNVGDTPHHLRLAAVVVGASSKARKGTSARPVKKLFQFDEGAARTSPGPFSSGEGIIYSVRDQVMTFDPKQGAEVISDPGITDKRFFVLDEEFGGALANTKREGNTLSCVLRSAWDSGDLDPITKTTRTRATGAHIGWVSHITLDELTRKLPESEGLNGFGNRILWCCSRRSKLVPLPEPMDAEALERMRQRLQRNVSWASMAGALHLSERAKKEWCERYYPELGAEKPGFVGVITNRAEAQVMRLSMAYALLDQSVEIEIDHLEAAVALWRYCEKSAALIFKGKVGDQTQERILKALKENSPLTGTEIRAIFSNHLSKDALAFALGELARSGRIESSEIKGPGRPITKYFLKTLGVLSAKSAISPQSPVQTTLIEHKALKAQAVSEKRKQEEERDMEKNPFSNAHQFSTIAISQLTRIRKEDPQWKTALLEAKEYVENQLKISF